MSNPIDKRQALPDHSRSFAWLDELAEFAGDRVESLLAHLVAAPSVNPPGNEGLAADELAAFLHTFGIESELQHTGPGRPNLLAAVGPKAGSPCLAFCSHLDVVSPGDVAAWSGDPFYPRRVGDRLYGRGSCDAKASLAAMALVLAFFSRRPELLPGALALAAVAGEEKGGTGSKYLVRSGFRADAAIIGEPTNMRLALGHKGRVQVSVVVRGRAGHAANPAAAINPIAHLGPVVEALNRLGERVAERHHPLVGAASLVPTQIGSGDTNACTIPEEIELTLDRRLLPTETHEAAAAEIEEALVHLDRVQVRRQNGAFPALQERDHSLVVAAQASLKPDQAPVVPFPATCDQYIWLRAGIPSIIMGPGDLGANRVHGIDEFIELPAVLDAVQIYAATAVRFLEAGE